MLLCKTKEPKKKMDRVRKCNKPWVVCISDFLLDFVFDFGTDFK